jgi:23S rRNA (cytidine1920-2'-O)/16S rRNA (cytidine1409-2'-O)-methyltransferase
MTARVRLDSLLADRGLFPSRSKAAAAVMAGEVRIEGSPAAKPGQLVREDMALEIAERPRYVSRGGQKLEAALEQTGLDPAGRRCLDVGASTGGFTDCLLKGGALEVVAVDVGYGELAWELREDPRVHVLERTNARHLEVDRLPFRPDLIVADCSFISLTKLLPSVLGTAAERYDALVMVKPQFELGKGRVGRGGVVRERDERAEAILSVAEFARDRCGATVLGFASSRLPGPKGNRETFVHLAEAGRDGGLSDLAEALQGVDL